MWGDVCLLTAAAVSPVKPTTGGAVTVIIVCLLPDCLQPTAPASAVAVTVKMPVGRTLVLSTALTQVTVYLYGSVPTAPRTSKSAGAAAERQCAVPPLQLISKECMIATGAACWGTMCCLGSRISLCCLLYTLLGRPSHVVNF